jgi:hypothetical protein
MCPGAATYRVLQQDHKLYIRLDNKFIDEAEPALTQGLPVSELHAEISTSTRNESAAIRTATAALRREVERVNVKMKEDLGTLKHECVSSCLPSVLSFSCLLENTDGVGQSEERGQGRFQAAGHSDQGNTLLYL